MRWVELVRIYVVTRYVNLYIIRFKNMLFPFLVTEKGHTLLSWCFFATCPLEEHVEVVLLLTIVESM